MIPFDFIKYYSLENVDFVLCDDIDFILDSFNNIDFILDESISIGEYEPILSTYKRPPDNVTSYCYTYILTEDDCIIMTEDGDKLTYE